MIHLQSIINLTLGSVSSKSESDTPTYNSELVKKLKELSASSTSIVDSEGRSYLDQLDPGVHTLTWLSIFSAHFRYLFEKRSDEIYSFLWLLKLSIPNFDVSQISVIPKIIGDLSDQLTSLALSKSITIEELPNQELAVLKLLLNLKSKLPKSNLLNPIHGNILKICLKTKMYPIGLKLINEHSYLDIENTKSPISILDYLTFHYYSALIYCGYKNYTKALEHLMLVLIAPGKNISQIQIESVKKGILVDLLNLKEQHDHFKRLIHKAGTENQKYIGLYTQIKSSSNIDQWNSYIQKYKQDFICENNWGLVQQVAKAYYPLKILNLKEFKLITFAQLSEHIGLRSADEVEGILVELIQSGKLNAKISFNSELGHNNGLLEFNSHRLPPNARERFDELVKDIESTLELNKMLQNSAITASDSLKRSSLPGNDPEALSQFSSMLD